MPREGIPGLGKRLRQLRIGRALTQQELAEPHYTAAYVSTIEAGKRRPSERALAHFAERLGIDPETLVSGRPPGLVSEVELGLVEARRLTSVGDAKEAAKRFETLLETTRRHRLSELEVKAIYGLGFCQERLEHPERAIEHYESAIKLAGPDLILIAVEATVGQARCHQMMGDVRLAIHILESALLTLQRSRLEDPSALLRIRASLVAAYFEAGLYQRSFENADEALQLAADVDDPERLAWMYLNSAWALHHRGRSKDAHETLVRAEHFFGQLELRLEIAQARLARGMLLSREGELARARGEFRAAAATFREVGSPINEARTLNELGRLERIEGNAVKARSSLEHAAMILEQLEYPGLLAWTKRELGAALMDHDPDLAEKSLLQALELYERADEPMERAIAYRHLGELRDNQGNKAGACEAYRLGISVLEPKL